MKTKVEIRLAFAKDGTIVVCIGEHKIYSTKKLPELLRYLIDLNITADESAKLLTECFSNGIKETEKVCKS